VNNRGQRQHGRRRPLRCATQAAAIVLAAMRVSCPLHAAPLSEADFHQIGEAGFGDRGNSYAWAMAYFRGKIYIGTNRHFLCAAPLQSSFVSGDRPQIPVECKPDLADMDMRARIYAYDPSTKAIELVHVSPTVEVLISDGSRAPVARDHGYRTMEVFREPDGTEALYVGSMVSPKLPGALRARLLRSTDGRIFSEVFVDVPGAGFTSFRSLTVYDQRLFVLGRSPNAADPGLLELRDPAEGFSGVADASFGDRTNQGGFEMEVFKGYLYIGTFNDIEGFQLVKTVAQGDPPYFFHRVLAQGAYRGPDSQSVVSLKAFKDRLYVGTGVFFGSSALNPEFTPAAAELLRVSADGAWELIVGDERATPDGFRAPLTGLPPGFGNAFTGYMWRMIVHDDVLYLGTLDNSVFAQYAQDIDLDAYTEDTILEKYPQLAELVELVGPDEIADVISALEGGFDLWATEDGADWRNVTRKGFNDEFNYGIRNFISLPTGLFVGSANPFLGLRFYVGQAPGADTDGDSFPDLDDNCPLDWNLDQADLDEDGIGDACDLDQDGDCLPDADDSQPRIPLAGLSDSDVDGLIDGCDSDRDGDGVLNHQDNCPTVSNYNQTDADGDGVGDACATPPGDDAVPGRPVDDAPGASKPMCGAVGWTLPLTFLFLAAARVMPIRRHD